MKALYLLVEGQTEEEFVKETLRPYLIAKGLSDVRPFILNTRVGYKGGFVNYDHLKRDAIKLVRQRDDVILTTLIDYFRIPHNIPNYNRCSVIPNLDERVQCLEKAMYDDMQNDRFIPYIQKHEFEALLFCSNSGFEKYFGHFASDTQNVIDQYPNPEDINDHPNTAPSKRLLNLIPEYDKVLFGNVLAQDVGIELMLEKCPRFRDWMDTLLSAVSRDY